MPVTDAGYSSKPGADILEDLAVRLRTELEDPNLNTSHRSVAGGILRAVAPEIERLGEEIQELVSAIDTFNASGVWADAIGALQGIPRIDQRRTRVLCTCTMGTTTIPAGSFISLDGAPEVRFYAEADIPNPTAAPTVDGYFVAENYGPVAVNVDTLTVIESAVTDWTAVTNADVGIVGQLVEDTPTYNIRRNSSQGLEGRGTLPAMTAAILALQDGARLTVDENQTSYPPVAPSTAPPFSYVLRIRAPEVSDNAIAEKIQEYAVAGYRPYGTTTVTLSSGDVVGFNRVTDVTWWIDALDVTGNPSLVSADIIAARVAAYSATLQFGEAPTVAKVEAYILATEGVTSVSGIVLGGDISPSAGELAVYDHSESDVGSWVLP